jgi:mannitol-specific phosphotransferase system IIBC component
MQQRVQERKQTHKESHTSPSLCSPLFFFSHHRILKHSKTKNASKFLETKSKIKARKKERKTQTQNTNKQGIAKTYETSRDSVLEI